MANVSESRATIAILGAAAIAVVGVLLGVLYWTWSAGPDAAQNAAPPQPQAQAPQAAPPQAAAVADKPAKAPAPVSVSAEKLPSVTPSFDLVRVEPNGESVIAGRAAPGATIELLRDEEIHARDVADASGLFAIVPPPLPPGTHRISLLSIAPDGARLRSQQSVTVVVSNAGTRPLVTLTTPDKPTVVLSNPEPMEPKTAEVQTVPAQTAEAAPPVNHAGPAEPAPAEQPAPPAPQQQAQPAQEKPEQAPPAPAAPRAEIKIVSVEAEEGKLYVSGSSAPGATVRLYLNESFIAPGGAGGDGKLSFSIASGVKPGDYRIRLDDVDPVSGQVRSRAEVDFNVPAQIASAEPMAATPPPAAGAQAENRLAPAQQETQMAAAGTVIVPSINTAIVSRGDNLWRISQRVYGKGYRYTVIYGANQDQIRNPDLIYPGQVFVLPSPEGPKTN